MKKTYMNPQVQVVSVTTQHFIATSNLEGQQANSSFSVSFSEEEYDGEGASRRGGWFDDDEY